MVSHCLLKNLLILIRFKSLILILLGEVIAVNAVLIRSLWYDLYCWESHATFDALFPELIILLYLLHWGCCLRWNTSITLVKFRWFRCVKDCVRLYFRRWCHLTLGTGGRKPNRVLLCYIVQILQWLIEYYALEVQLLTRWCSEYNREETVLMLNLVGFDREIISKCVL